MTTPTPVTTAAALIAAAARKSQTIPVRGVSLCIVELSLAGRDAFLAALPKGQAATAAAVLLHGVVNPETGAPLLTEEEAAQLQQSSAGFVQDAVSAILKLSGMTPEDEGGNSES